MYALYPTHLDSLLLPATLLAAQDTLVFPHPLCCLLSLLAVVQIHHLLLLLLQHYVALPPPEGPSLAEVGLLLILLGWRGLLVINAL